MLPILNRESRTRQPQRNWLTRRARRDATIATAAGVTPGTRDAWPMRVRPDRGQPLDDFARQAGNAGVLEVRRNARALLRQRARATAPRAA